MCAAARRSRAGEPRSPRRGPAAAPAAAARPWPLTVGADGVVGVRGGWGGGRLSVVHPAEPLHAVVVGAVLVLHRHHGEVRHGCRGSPRHGGQAGGTRRGAGGAFLPRAVTSSQETALLNSTHSPPKRRGGEEKRGEERRSEARRSGGRRPRGRREGRGRPAARAGRGGGAGGGAEEGEEDEEEEEEEDEEGGVLTGAGP